MPNLDAIPTEVREWYDRYVVTFTRLARGDSSDLEAMLEFYAVPLTVISDSGYQTFADRASLLSFWGEHIEQARRAHYAGSTIHHLDVRALNTRAALVEGAFSRHDSQGHEYARFGATYLAGKTIHGWRFTALIISVQGGPQ
jgi:hypothetical protein